MAITITNVSKPYTTGDRWQTVNKIALDNNYPTGGYSVKPGDLGFASTVDPEFLVEVNDTNGYTAVYDYTNQKLVFYTSAGTQTTNATDLSAITAVRVVATGKYRA